MAREFVGAMTGHRDERAGTGASGVVASRRYPDEAARACRQLTALLSSGHEGSWTARRALYRSGRGGGKDASRLEAT